LLETPTLGGLSAGTPVYHRDRKVGEVAGYEVRPEGTFRLRVFVHHPHDREVVSTTRFWNVSGLSILSEAGGLTVRVESLRALLTGGIEFRSPMEPRGRAPVPAETSFTLYDTQALAELGFQGPTIDCVSYFHGSARGLTAGSPVEMFGQRVGLVTRVSLARDPQADHEGELAARVRFALQPELGLPGIDGGTGHEGFVAVLETQNLLTGTKVITLERSTDSDQPNRVEEGVVVLPGKVRDFRELADSLAGIVEEVDQIRFAEIGRELEGAVVAVRGTVASPKYTATSVL
jgi:paraquat-inducible protein B